MTEGQKLLNRWNLVEAETESENLSASYSPVVLVHVRVMGTQVEMKPKKKRMKFLTFIPVLLERCNNLVYNSPLDMLFSGVLQITQKVATQHGACQALTAFWKNSMGTYHENGKVRSYD